MKFQKIGRTCAQCKMFYGVSYIDYTVMHDYRKPAGPAKNNLHKLRYILYSFHHCPLTEEYITLHNNHQILICMPYYCLDKYHLFTFMYLDEVSKRENAGYKSWY